MAKPSENHVFRTTIKAHPLRGLPADPKINEKQRQKKLTRERIEQIMEQREFDKEWGEQ